MFKKKYLIFPYFLFFTILFGQNIYKTGKIPDLNSFEKLTRYEQHLDSVKTKYRETVLKMIKSDSIFNDDTGFSKEDKKNYIEYETAMNSLLFKENRSRYNLKKKFNGKSEIILSKDTLSTECDCVLKGDSIKIKMGIWVFGGFEIKALLHKNIFTSTFEVDTHKYKILKANLSTPYLSNNLVLKNKKQELLLQKQPEFKINELVIGYFTFSTPDYYQSYDYGMDREVYSDQNMDTLSFTGKIYFKCRVRKQTFLETLE